MKVILIHADWCAVCQATKKFWNDLGKDISFEYKEVNLTSPEGIGYVKKHEIHSVPVTLIDDKVAFFGLPERKKAMDSLKNG
ncbi:MAG: thioredoxin family protein [Candidatus Methanoperedens sp.]|nr:thioredoxin family protein [Candidatus Methanoperedens sp.]